MEKSVKTSKFGNFFQKIYVSWTCSLHLSPQLKWKGKRPAYSYTGLSLELLYAFSSLNQQSLFLAILSRSRSSSTALHVKFIASGLGRLVCKVYPTITQKYRNYCSVEALFSLNTTHEFLGLVSHPAKCYIQSLSVCLYWKGLNNFYLGSSSLKFPPQNLRNYILQGFIISLSFILFLFQCEEIKA